MGRRLTDDEIAESIEQLVRCEGNKHAAARALGITHSSLHARLHRARQRGFDVPEFEQKDNLPSNIDIDLNQIPDPEQHPTMRVRHVVDELGTYQIIAIGDSHDAPALSKDRFRWLGKFSRAHKPDFIIQIGDFATFDSLSSWDLPGTQRQKENPTFTEDLASAEAALQAFAEGLRGYSCERHVVFGNHEDRVWSFENRNPAIVNMLQMEIDRLFGRHGWSYSLFAQPYFIGGVAFSHVPLNTMSKPMGGELQCANIAAKSIFDWVSGHSHRAEVSRRPKLGGYHVTAINLGCSLPTGHLERYIKHGTMTGWWYGAWVIRISQGQIQSYQQHTMAELEEKYG